ncbi:MAG: ATP-binding protein [Bacteroidia bacterium]
MSIFDAMTPELYPRSLTKSIQEQASKFPVLALTGPRQSGKTTLLREIFPDYRYVTLEEQDVRSLAIDDPRAFLKEFNSKVIFDEAQRAPSLFSYIQTLVDEKDEMGRFILSGSQNFHLMEQISQSLAGRVAIFRLFPLDSGELPSFVDKNNWQELILKGFYPAIYQRGLRPEVFYDSYLQTYIDRDVRSLTKVQDFGAFRKLLNLCAGRIGQVLNYASLASEVGVSQPTIKNWLKLLELSYIVFQFPPYYENFNKRATKSSKLYFYDTGLAAYLLGLRPGDNLLLTELRGHLFENLVIADILKKNNHLNLLRKYYFWRDQHGLEVDLLSPKALKFDIAEIKASSTIKSRLFEGMDKFDVISQNRVSGKTLIYGGEQNQDRTNYEVRNWYSYNG